MLNSQHRPIAPAHLTIGASPSTALAVALSAVVGFLHIGGAPTAQGRDILRAGSAGTSAPPAAAGANRPLGPSASAQLRAQGQDRLSRASQAIQSVKAMQNAARNAALNGPNKLTPALPNVPNGLVKGGLQVAPGVPLNLKRPQEGENPALWVGAKLPKQTTDGGKTTVTIKQTQQQALLNWQTFNVGKETTVRFDQSKGGSNSSKWIAFNKIADPTGVPSQILGSIEAPGQVYLINPNGIIFGGSSQINLRTLVASALPINDNLISRGLLNNPDAQFLFSGLAMPAGAVTPAFTPVESFREDGLYGDVVVQKGAVINSATSSDNVGGRVALIGANVTNEGSISTPDGQTILAAGLQVGFAAHPGSDPSLRGLDVYIGAVRNPKPPEPEPVDPPAGETPPTEPPVVEPPVVEPRPVYAGSATNSGFIDAPRASVTIAGKDVGQSGVINSTTSVAVNGRIDLVADYNAISNLESNGANISSTGGIRNLNPFLFLPRETGTVTLGEGSVTQIIPELSSAESITGTELPLKSQVNIQGKAIHLDSGAQIIAPSGNVAMSAGTWQFAPGASPRTNFIYSGGQIYLDSGVTVDVSGSTNISAEMAKNILAVELRGAEFADAPLQRTGVFRGLTINVDVRQSGIYNGRVWTGTPLADAAGYVGLIERTVGELTTAGGTVKMNAGGSVVMQGGAAVDVSGGWIDYEGGIVQTSRVVSGGRLLDISQATPDVVYNGFYSGKFTTASPKYGIEQTFSHPLNLGGAHYEEGYRFGAAGGSIAISAPSMALDGDLRGHTVSGPRQRSVPAPASSISVAFLAQDVTQPFPNFSPTPPRVTFSASSTLAAADPFQLDLNGDPLPLRADRQADVVLSPELFTTSGFGNLRLDNTDGDVLIPDGVSISTPAGGSLLVKGSNITIDGGVSAPAGTLSFEVFNVSQAVRNTIALAEVKETPAADPTRGFFILGPTASLSTAGLLVDDRRDARDRNTLPLLTNGGAITIAGYDVRLDVGSTIDVSGGIAVTANNRRTYGNGGRISISAGQDLNIRSVIGGELLLGATMTGFAGATGGSLSVLAPSIQIGGTTANPDTLLLDAGFFNQGGFTAFSLTGRGLRSATGDFIPGVKIAPGTSIAPEVESAMAFTTLDGKDLVMTPVLKPEGLRSPVSLTFGAAGLTDQFESTLLLARGDVVLGQGATIDAGARGSVTLTGNTVTALGSIFAPGGSISMTGRNSNALELQNNSGTALVNVHLSENTVLSTAGTTLLTPDIRGNRSGTVLAGGTITVAGNILAEAGSKIDVSGTSGVLDMAPAFSAFLGVPDGPAFGWNITTSITGAPVKPTLVESNAGRITLSGDQALFTDALLVGAAGGASARGGTLTIGSGRYVPLSGAEPSTPLDVTLDVQQTGAIVQPQVAATGKKAIGRAVLRDGLAVEGRGYVSVSSFSTGGFESLDLKGTVRFTDAVNIAMPGALRIADAGVIYADAPVTLTAGHVAIGSAFRAPLSPLDPKSPFTIGSTPFNFLPTSGAGNLTVSGTLIDVGNLSLQGIGKANFIADSGDIRGNGTLSVAGDIFIRAGQVYTPTAATFTISASDFIIGERAAQGSVTIAASGSRGLPLSAAGTLNVYATNIDQGGVLRAPLGTINLGWNGEGDAPIDPITGVEVAITERLNLSRGSLTSVSAIDPVSGEAMVIPFGLNKNGNTWIDPTGTDITAGNFPAKEVNISALKVASLAGSQIDIGGGGDLYAFRWVQGAGGSQDILASEGSFAVIPGYDANYAPFAPFNTGTNAGNLSGEVGYVNSNLQIGDRIYLAGSSELAAGEYTLLPARYGLLPGAVLVTPRSGAPVGTYTMADGTSLVPGYRFNGIASTPSAAPTTTWFELGSTPVIRARAEYQDYAANTFLAARADELGITAPRLPIDSGRLLLEATNTMILQGRVNAGAPLGGRGGPVDISSPADILIAGAKTDRTQGTLVLDAGELSRFGAESLLIGGVREFGPDGTRVSITANNLIVDNAGTKLTGPELILVANENLVVAEGAEISQAGNLTGDADRLLFGLADAEGSGDGTMLRISSDKKASSSRVSLSDSESPNIVINAGARLAGTSITLDSTAGGFLDPTASLNASTITLNSGRISIELEDPGDVPSSAGLVLGGGALAGLQTARTLNLLSYSTIDIYGTGQVSTNGTLALHSAQIRGFNNEDGDVVFSAPRILLDNSARGTILSSSSANSGTLSFDADRITVGANRVRVDQFAGLELNARSGVLFSGVGGLGTQGTLKITSPQITASGAANHEVIAGGAVTISAPAGAGDSGIAGGLGAKLQFVGTSVKADGLIRLPSGELTLQATAGDVVIEGLIDVAGTSQAFYDQMRYTGGGVINLQAANGSVRIEDTATLSVSAQVADAGVIRVSAPKGTISLDGTVQGEGLNGGKGGSFALDIRNIAGGSVGGLNSTLDAGGFNESRMMRIRSGNVVFDGAATARDFRLSADSGTITVNGFIDASGKTGGNIELNAAGSLILSSTARLTVAGETFDSAGKGGSIFLGAGALTGEEVRPDALLDIRRGAQLDLSVASNTADSVGRGQFSGTLHLRAPQNSGGTDIQIAAIGGNVVGASSIVAEGFRVYDLTASGGLITTQVRNSIRSNGDAFLGASGTASPTYEAMVNRLLAGNGTLSSVFSMQVGAEIINRDGDLTLGSASSSATNDWNLAGFRFGTKNSPGTLTMRASGDLVFFNALSDGFNTSAYDSALLNLNPLLGANAQSWSYRLAAGADLTSADFRGVLPLTSLDEAKGSLLLGKNYGTNVFLPSGTNAQTRTALQNRFQVIRTGSGNIDISAGRDVQLLNQFATIYTAGTKVADPTDLAGGFDLPILNAAGGESALGAVQQNPGYGAQYSLAGGNITINAGGDIIHLTRNSAGELIADSSKQLPTNWLYRRGYVDPATGQFGVARFGDVASTTWWVDFSNFFEGVGTLGGGNIELIAARDISNVDAVAPTNARMPKGTPDKSALVELGGGDITIRAGRDIDGGIYYVERGSGSLTAGGSIHTNATRSPSRGAIVSPVETFAPATWLPTTLFAGKASFDVSASGDLLLGPVANAFLTPSGYNNTFWYKTYFSTYSADADVNVSSLGGDVTFRFATTLPTSGGGSASPILQAWLQNVSVLQSNPQSVSFYQPWLRLNESSAAPFGTLVSVLPPNLEATAFSRNINIVGDATLFPSSTGNLELTAAGSIVGLRPNGESSVEGETVVTWGSSRINLSDADPNRVPGIASPFAFQTVAGITPALARQTTNDFLLGIDQLFAETGSSRGAAGVLQVKQALHAPGLLHAGDENPLRIYASAGDITGLTLFSGKESRVFAGRDISDAAFYIQNVASDDISTIAAGRDIIPLNENSTQRLAAQATGNILNLREELPLAGDIQINGPGTLEVLAGRNLDLGNSPIRADGTSAGITSIGNARNPALPSGGASIVAGAGLGDAYALENSKADFDSFLELLEENPSAPLYLAELADRGLTKADSLEDLQKLPTETRNLLALEMFYLVLRDAGRAQPTTGNYETGFAAIEALFPGTKWQGDISLASRQIKTSAGGDVTLFAPGGELIVGFDAAGEQSADQGVLTEAGGNISIFTDGNVTVGTSRIFTLRGGNEIIWSSNGNIAAGSAAKTVQSAPPTRVLIDPQTSDVATDLAGLATGGGIGVLATVKDVPPGDVDLIAPRGAIDAGDAGIRVSGNLRIAATQVLNAANIQVVGGSTGVPSTPTVAAPSLGGLSAAASSSAATNSAASSVAQNRTQEPTQEQDVPSLITVEVLGYGGGESSTVPAEEDEDEEKRRKREQEAQEPAPVGNASRNSSAPGQVPS